MTGTDHLSPEDAALYAALYAERNHVHRPEYDAGHRAAVRASRHRFTRELEELAADRALPRLVDTPASHVRTTDRSQERTG